MSPDEARKLQIGDRVYWDKDLQDQGAIVERNWSGVKVRWDSSQQVVFCHYNDMSKIELVPRAG
jgi:hypothetical protein